MIPVAARILLRYPAGFLLGMFFVPQDIIAQVQSDPDLTLMVGAGITAGVEGFYRLAKKKGWKT